MTVLTPQLFLNKYIIILCNRNEFKNNFLLFFVFRYDRQGDGDRDGDGDVDGDAN